jgi:hypothetical protein
LVKLRVSDYQHPAWERKTDGDESALTYRVLRIDDGSRKRVGED